jgi:hypothetical protein
VADKLSVAEESGRTVVVGVEEGFQSQQITFRQTWMDILSGFFLRNRKHVSISSTNLVR